MNTLINSCAPLQNLHKNKESFHKNHGLQKESKMQLKRKSALMYIKCVDCNKNSLHQEYKTYRNSLSTLLKQTKKCYYNNYFRHNINNIKNTWKGIKWIISLHMKESESPKIILNNTGEFLTKPNDTANQFNNFFFVLLHLQFSVT